jgi:hypothetical protein
VKRYPPQSQDATYQPCLRAEQRKNRPLAESPVAFLVPKDTQATFVSGRNRIANQRRQLALGRHVSVVPLRLLPNVKSNLTMPRPIISPLSLVGLLWTASGIDRIPADGWPLEGAIEELASDLAMVPALAPAVRALLTSRIRADRRVTSLRSVLREAAATGAIKPQGKGAGASYRAQSDWLQRHRDLLQYLDADERAALAHSAQRLVALTTIWSKKWVA